jgi:hypothetical protein
MVMVHYQFQDMRNTKMVEAIAIKKLAHTFVPAVRLSLLSCSLN